jgi:phage FluMu protein Com
MALQGRGAEPERGLHEVRCRRCGTLLFKADGWARVEIVCRSRECRVMQTVKLGAARREA